MQATLTVSRKGNKQNNRGQESKITACSNEASNGDGVPSYKNGGMLIVYGEGESALRFVARVAGLKSAATTTTVGFICVTITIQHCKSVEKPSALLSYLSTREFLRTGEKYRELRTSRVF